MRMTPALQHPPCLRSSSTSSEMTGMPTCPRSICPFFLERFVLSRYTRAARALLPLIIIAAVTASILWAQLSEAGGKKNPLWKVTSKYGTVYLLGSVHLLKHSDYPLDERIGKALQDSEVAVFELDFQESATEESRGLLSRYSTFGDKQTLKGSLSADTYKKMADILSARSMDISRAEKLKPWYMATIITVTELQSLGFKPEFGVDAHMYTKALTMGKEIQALETLEYQLGIFNSMSISDQEAFVRQTLKELDTLRLEFPVIVKAWKNGDTKGLLRLLESCKDFQETCDRIIDQRNLHWMPRIEGILKSGRSAIIIAGAGHMVGENGLLRLLANKGYKVEQL